MKSLQLDDAVRDLIAASGKSDFELAVMSGMTPGWIYNLRKGRIKSPNFRSLQGLYEQLSGKPLIKKVNNG